MESKIRTISRKISLVFIVCLVILIVSFFILMNLTTEIQIVSSIVTGIIAGLVVSLMLLASKKIIALDNEVDEEMPEKKENVVERDMNKETKITPYIDAGHRMMIWRRKMSEKGFTKKDMEQFEEDTFRGYLSQDVAKTLQKSKEIQKETIGISKQVKKDSRRASQYFLLAVLVAIGSMLLSIAIHLSG